MIGRSKMSRSNLIGLMLILTINRLPSDISATETASSSNTATSSNGSQQQHQAPGSILNNGVQTKFSDFESSQIGKLGASSINFGTQFNMPQSLNNINNKLNQQPNPLNSNHFDINLNNQHNQPIHLPKINIYINRNEIKKLLGKFNSSCYTYIIL